MVAIATDVEAAAVAETIRKYVEAVEHEDLARSEDAVGDLVLKPGEVREILSNVTLLHSPVPMPEHGQATRIRFGDGPEGSVQAVRAWFRARGRERFVWSIGPSTTPADLEQRLLDLGAEPSPGQPDATAMVLDREPTRPPEPPAGIEVRRVASLADYFSMWEIMFEGFDMPQAEREAIRATLEARWREVASDDTGWAYLALLDGVPAAMGSVRRMESGPLWLSGGATLPSCRGRGLYRALVQARWDDAVRLGAGGLVVQASHMSGPILERLGFRAVAAMRFLMDRSATS